MSPGVTWCPLVADNTSYQGEVWPGPVGRNYSSGNHGDNNYITSMVTHTVTHCGAHITTLPQHGNADDDPLIQHCECQ